MAQIIEIDDVDAEDLSDYTHLRDVQLRRSLEAKRGLFVAEGIKIIRRALEAGYRPRSFMLASKWYDQLRPLVDDLDLPIYLCEEKEAEKITGFHVHRGALGIFEREQRYHLDDLINSRRLIVCEDIVDHTNVGAIIRCAAGLGWDGILLAPRAADPLYRRAIKTSMGSSLVMPWARIDDWKDGLLRLKEAGFVLAAMALSEGAIDLDNYAATVGDHDKIAILMGTEGDGLSSRWLSQADVTLTIPMARGIDSLNVAAACAIACYQLRPHQRC